MLLLCIPNKYIALYSVSIVSNHSNNTVPTYYMCIYKPYYNYWFPSTAEALCYL